MKKPVLDTSVGALAYPELVASLFATRLPTMIMTGLFALVGGLVATHTRDRAVLLLLIAGLVASIARIGIVLIDGRRVAAMPLTTPKAVAVERRFAVSYLAFAILLGLFCARALAVAPAALDTLVAVLATGYAAGVASGVTLRPRIAVAAILVAVVPSIAVALATAEPTGVALGVTLAAFLLGGLRSMQARYRLEIGQIALRRTYEILARRDPLTQIANRRGLEEHYDLAVAAGSGRIAAVHCLDLDGFKSVNDRHGHDAGDALLVAVANTLSSAAPDAIAARLGGDEFVLVRFGLADAAAAAASARDLERLFSRPWPIDGVTVDVGVSIGTAFGAEPLHALLRQADLRQRICKARHKADTRVAGPADLADAGAGASPLWTTVTAYPSSPRL